MTWIEFMASHGCMPRNPGKIKMTGDIERFDIEGHKKGKLAGWVIHRGDSCTFGDWRNAGQSYTWFEHNQDEMTQKQKNAMKRRITEDRIRMAKAKADDNARIEAARAAAERYNRCVPADIHHPYLERKRIEPCGIRYDADTGDLLVPVMHFTGGIQSLQTISGCGKKRFHPGCAMAGGHYRISGKGEFVFISEGFATAATIRKMTGCESVCCFNAGNIMRVTGYVKSSAEGKKVVICADNDHHLPPEIGNVGEKKALDAGLRHGVTVMLIGTDKYGTDWNDVYCIAGEDEAMSMFSVQYDLVKKR